jgi:ribosome-binding protein aMBF1 (putative translation factor)
VATVRNQLRCEFKWQDAPKPLDDHLPTANTLAGRLVRQRTSLGLSQKEMAGRLGVAPGTLARWERGEREPEGALLERVERFLDEAEAGLDARRVG